MYVCPAIAGPFSADLHRLAAASDRFPFVAARSSSRRDRPLRLSAIDSRCVAYVTIVTEKTDSELIVQQMIIIILRLLVIVCLEMID